MNEEQKEQNIYSFGFDKSLNKPFVNRATGVVYDAVSEALNAGQVLSGGNLNLKTLSIGSLVRQVAPGDDIQAAIDAVNREGGGTVQLIAGDYLLTRDIELKSKVKLNGAGRDVSILNFQNLPYGIFVNGGGNYIRNFSIENLTVSKSNANGGIYLTWAESFGITNVRTTLCQQDGIFLSKCLIFNIIGCLSDNNTSDGISSDGDVTNGNFLNCYINTNSAIGMNISGANLVLTNCEVFQNTGHGIYLNTLYSKVIGCYCYNNTGTDLTLNISTSKFNTITGTRATNVIIGGDQNCIVGCETTVFDSTPATNVTLVGNQSNAAVSADPNLAFRIKDISIESQGNIRSSLQTQKRMAFMTTSGVAVRAGNVVVYDFASDNAQKISTTSTNGNNKVMGMAMETINSTFYGNILVEGFTSTLYIFNGTTSIVIGDWLSTYSHAYYAKKAVAGDMAFAIALSSPTTSTAQISALLVSPRLI